MRAHSCIFIKIGIALGLSSARPRLQSPFVAKRLYKVMTAPYNYSNEKLFLYWK